MGWEGSRSRLYVVSDFVEPAESSEETFGYKTVDVIVMGAKAMIERVVVMVKEIVDVVVTHVKLPLPPSQYHVPPQLYPSFPPAFHSRHYYQKYSPHFVIGQEEHDIE
jgi:hypothetical protein